MSTGLCPDKPGFKPVLSFPTQPFIQGLIGWQTPPGPVADPLISQPGNVSKLVIPSSQVPPDPAIVSGVAARGVPVSIEHGLLIPRQSTDTDNEMLKPAFELLAQGRTKDAGTVFGDLRRCLEGSELDPPEELHSAYTQALIAEALYDPGATGSTYQALDRLMDHAESRGNVEVQLGARIVYSHMVSRKGGAHTRAIDRLEEIPQISGLDLTRSDHRQMLVQSRIALMSTYLQRGIELRKKRTHDFNMVVNHVLPDLRKDAGTDQNLQELVADLHAYAAGCFVEQGYPVQAYEVVRILKKEYPQSEATGTFEADGNPLAAYLDDTGNLKHASGWRSIRAGLADAVVHARFETNKSALAAILGSAAAGMATASVWSFATGQELDLSTLTAFGGSASSLFFASAKAMKGWNSEESRQSRLTGHSRVSSEEMWKNLIWRAAEVAGVHLIMGAPVFGLGLADGIPGLESILLDSNGVWGQMYGIGSAEAFIYSGVAAHSVDWINQIMQYGPILGTEEFWSHFSTNNPLGQTLQSAWDFYANFVDYVVSADGMNRDIINGLLDMSSDIWSYETLDRGLQIAAGTYGLVTLSIPGARDWLKKRVGFGPHLLTEAVMIAGAYRLGINLALALDVAVTDALLTPGVAMVQNAIFQKMRGKETRWRDTNLADILRQGFITTLFAGVGDKMLAGIDASTLGDQFSKSLGIIPAFAPIIAALVLTCRFNPTQTIKSTAFRAPTTESFLINIPRMFMGWSTWYGTAYAETMQSFVNWPWMFKLANLYVGKPVVGRSLAQESLVNANQPSLQTGETSSQEQSSQSLESLSKNMGRKWDFTATLTGSSLVERLPYCFAFYMALTDKEEPFPTAPEPKFYSMVYQTLSASRDGMTAEVMEQYLDNLTLIAGDLSPERRDVRRNLLVATWAARSGDHGQEINEFFDRQGWVFDHYDIDRNMALPPQGGALLDFRRNRWFNRELSGARQPDSGDVSAGREAAVESA